MAERTTTQGTVKQSRRVTEVMVVNSYALTTRKFASTSACDVRRRLGFVQQK